MWGYIVSLREWLSSHWDDLVATIFMAVMVSALVGFFKRSTGMAIVISCAAATTLALISFIVLTNMGYDWKVTVPILGPGSGLLAMGFLRIAIKLADRLGERDQEIADKLINKGLNSIPGSDK